jgi:fructokinase
LNLDELCELLNNPEIQLTTASDPVTKLRQDFGIDNVLLTAGKDGAMLQGSYGEALHTPAPPPEPFVDAVGAGDALAAATLHGVLNNLPAEHILEKAMTFASRVCGLRGATTTETSFYTL